MTSTPTSTHIPRRTIIASLIFLLPLHGAKAGGIPVIDFASILQLIMQVKQQFDAYTMQAMQYELLFKQVASGNLTGLGAFMGLPPNVMQAIDGVNRLYQSVVSLGSSFQQIQSMFNKTYGAIDPSLTFVQRTSAQFDTTLDALKNTALAAGKVRDDFLANNAALTGVNRAMDAAVQAQNQTAVIQANGKLAALAVQHLQTMENVMTVQMESMSAYQADQIKKYNDAIPKAEAVIPKAIQLNGSKKN